MPHFLLFHLWHDFVLVTAILDFTSTAGLSKTEFFVYIPDRKISPLLFSDHFLAERLKQKNIISKESDQIPGTFVFSSCIPSEQCPTACASGKDYTDELFVKS